MPPSAHAADNLEGTQKTISGDTVFEAIVSTGDTYASVYGVRGYNTNSKYYGVVKIDGGTVSNTVYGNRATSAEDLTTSRDNTVTIKNATIGESGKAGYVYGASADGFTISVTDNEVKILNNSTVEKTIYGGCAFNTSSWLSMLRNDVIIEDSIVNVSVYGGYASGSATASNRNTVIISGLLGSHVLLLLEIKSIHIHLDGGGFTVFI